MPIYFKSRPSDIVIRLTGLSFLPVGALAIHTLYRLVHAGPFHDSTAAELGLAAVGFISFSLGSLLLALGAHIFDEVEISPRWAPRHDLGPRHGPIDADETRLGDPHPDHVEASISARGAVEKVR